MAVNKLNTKIFLTDQEFEELFGSQIAALVKILNETASKTCRPCNGICCENIHCVFYSKSFSICPIFAIRPRECRYHFCNEVFINAPLSREEKEMMVKPVEELICGNRGDIARLFFLFPEFPLDEKGLVSIGIKEDVEGIVSEFEKGGLDERNACQRLMAICNKWMH